jgi:hypothetical protein
LLKQKRKKWDKILINKTQMEIKSITEIKNRRDEIRELIKSSDVKLYAGQTFGSENEYSYKSLIGGIEALLTDISTLLRSPSRFIKISTYSERSTLNTYLQNIKTYINDPGNLYAQVDQLKLLLRPYNLRFFEDRFIEFEKEIDEARKIKINLQEDKAEVVKIIESIKSDEETVEEKITYRAKHGPKRIRNQKTASKITGYHACQTTLASSAFNKEFFSCFIRISSD